ncbi:hypothetical protein TKK_0018732 [Trichogramma kaykai]|uniref:IRS-type PTB domain-containing protein n=1 Tax=Trichogramma kaykai TaxID=54128 RepID=A0ABD2VXJ6_9HYME
MVDNNCIIEGNVKFRDGKKWKSRWCVMRKLSPVADCLHLQLYGDSKDRYKQGQTKASLSLQHFLGVEAGFTLDKESNTVAIICQDVTVVLAFDTRERLIQWQVKISSNLGEDQQFLILLSSAPTKAKLSSGPAHLHIQERRFCMTVGVPPRLVGTWEIGQLRRYGVVEGRFCFEGGSRCGRGEGLFVLITDQGDEIVRAFQLAAEGKLPLGGRKRPHMQSLAPTGSSAQDSPRRQFSRSDTRASDLTFPGYAASLAGCFLDEDGFKDASSSYWSSTESRQDESEVDFSGNQMELERCSSCVSGKMSMKAGPLAAGHLQPRAFDRLSLSSYSSSSHDSDYSASPQPQAKPQQQQHQHQQSRVQSPSPLALPPRPPKPPLAKAPKKPPMPLPLLQQQQQQQQCTCSRRLASSTPTTTPPSRNGFAGPYENYDIPKTLTVHQAVGASHAVTQTANPQQQPHPSHEPKSPVAEQFNYDTPRKIKECLAASTSKLGVAYPNYDTPHVPQPVVLKQCGCPAVKTPPPASAMAVKNLAACPCHNVMSWAGFVLPYCRRGAGIEPSTTVVQPVRLSGEGKMPVVNASGRIGIYNGGGGGLATTSHEQNGHDCDCPLSSANYSCDSSSGPKANYENVVPLVIDSQPEAKAANAANYANVDFTESLGNYENSRDILAKVHASTTRSASREELARDSEACHAEQDSEDLCHKCGHLKEIAGPQQSSYLVIDQEQEDKKQQQQHQEDKRQQTSGYISMQPVHNACSRELLSRLCSGVKSSSNPALSGAVGQVTAAATTPNAATLNLENSKKRSESEYRMPGSAILSSPYFRRRLLEMSSGESGGSSSNLGVLALRKRSYSTESAHCLDEDKPSSPSSDNNEGNESNALADEPTAKEQQISVAQVHEPPAKCSSPQPLAAIKIRRSSSVPSKAGHNRDSSSSNDSGVSTGSLCHRTGEFVEYEYPSAPVNTLVKKQSVSSMYRKSPPPACFHSSLPRKSKSSELTFQFHKTKLPEKSSSAEADIPTCLPSKSSAKEFSSPGEGSGVPYIDSRSTSSGTSDMSDYIETLSLSSHSSSDAPDNLRITAGRSLATTLRPRSGKEYYKIDRSMLVEQNRNSSNYANINPFTRKESLRHQVT